MAAIVTYDAGASRFVARIPIVDAGIAESHGFKWSLVRRRWESGDQACAKAIPYPKDAIATERIAVLEAELAAAMEESWATDADFHVPAPNGLEYLRYQVAGIRYASRRDAALIADEPGLGKGHPLWGRLHTTTGLKAIGDLNVGDEVLGSDGHPVRVEAIYDRGVLPTFRVALNDGIDCIVDGEHLWRVRGNGDWEVVETLDLRRRMAAGESFEIPLMDGIARIDGVEPPIEAAAWGSMLARPSLFADGVTDIPVERILQAPASYRQRFLYAYLSTRAYFRPDGTITIAVHEPRNETRFADILPELVRSLGGLCFEDTGPAFKGRATSFDIHLPSDLALATFALHRPKYRHPRLRRSAGGMMPARRIVSIETYGREPVRCIQVAAQDRLYLAEGHVVTHNTVQAVGVANVVQARRVLVLCPASLKVNWRREWSKWSVQGTVGIAGTVQRGYVDPATGKRKYKAVPDWPDTDCVILNYDLLKLFETQVTGTQWDLLVCDEAHGLKSKNAARTKIVFGHYDKSERRHVPPIPARRRLFLTGTPIVNVPADLWNIIQACDPLGLGRDWEAFACEYCDGQQTNFGFQAIGATNLPDLHQKLRSRFMVRRLKNDVLVDLPPKSRQVIVLPNDGLRAKVDAERDAVAAALAMYEAELGIRPIDELTVDDLADLVSRFRAVDFQAYSDEVTDGEEDANPTVTDLARARADLALMKCAMVVEHVKRLLESETKVIVFAWHKDVIAALREAFPGCASISGDTPSTIRKDGSSARQDQVDRFQSDPDCHVFVGQIMAAGTGHTLTAARVVVFAELDWVPGNVTQAEDRAHRYGQRDHVLVQHLVVENSLDDRVVQSLIAKQAIITEALDGGPNDDERDRKAGPLFRQGGDRGGDRQGADRHPPLHGTSGEAPRACEDHRPVEAYHHPRQRPRAFQAPRPERLPPPLCRGGGDRRRSDEVFGCA